MRTEDYEVMHALESNYWWFVGMREVTTVLLKKHVSGAARSILDIGCGTGINLIWMSQHHRPELIVGCDYSATALRLCRRTLCSAAGRSAPASPLLAQGDVRRLPFASASFDLVTTLDVLDSLGTGEDAEAMAELYRLLRPGGTAFVREPAYQWLHSSHDTLFETRHRYTAVELGRMMRTAGFEIIATTYANTILFPLAMTQRLLRRWFGFAGDKTDTQPWPGWLAWLDAIFRGCLTLEARLLSAGSRLPYGLSAICIGRRRLA